MKIKVIATQEFIVIRDRKGHKLRLEPNGGLELVNNNKTYTYDEQELESQDLVWEYNKDCYIADWFDEYNFVDLYDTETENVIRIFYQKL